MRRGLWGSPGPRRVLAVLGFALTLDLVSSTLTDR